MVGSFLICSGHDVKQMFCNYVVHLRFSNNIPTARRSLASKTDYVVLALSVRFCGVLRIPLPFSVLCGLRVSVG